MKLKLENIRGFAGKHQLDIKPLTILVGENSSGKTTLLAALYAALQIEFPGADVFNRSPFELGSFDTISTFRGGRSGRAPYFAIGWEDERAEERSEFATFDSFHGTPRLASFEIGIRGSTLSGKVDNTQWTLTITSSASRSNNKTHKFIVSVSNLKTYSLANIVNTLLSNAFKSKNTLRKQSATPDLERQAMETLYELSRFNRIPKPHVTALAPLRTRPHRTYDELIDDFKPEGDHIPLVLARISSSESGDERQNVTSAISSFGSVSGLFKRIIVKRMGRRPSDPFQLRVKSAGPDVNLVDVGYGVSQSLPIIVDSIRASKNEILLIQQPEVHLHPKAQAALGSFFAEQVRETGKHFIIETHSDYLIDRIRMAVANKIIKPNSVNIAFLDRNGLDVSIHQLRLDENGNILNAPPNYRSFFLQEEMDLLFRGKQ